MSLLRKLQLLDSSGINVANVDANGNQSIVIYNSSGTEILTTVNRGQVDIYSPLPTGTNTIGKVKITDGTEDVDIVDKSMQTISHAHAEVHKGNYFTVQHTFLSVANGVTVYLRVLNGATKELHGEYSVVAELKSYVNIYERTTYTANGTSKVIYNNNRTNALSGSPTASTALAYHTPTISALGTDLSDGGVVLPAGSKTKGIGGQSSSRIEIIGAVSTDYLIAVTSAGGAGSSNDITIIDEWYEETI